MLIVSGKRAVCRDDRPAVAQLSHLVRTGAHHRLYGDRHSGNKPRSAPGSTVVRHIGSLVKLSADAVTDIFAYHAVAALFTVFLNGMTDITDTVALPELLGALVKAVAGAVDKRLSLG